MQAKKGQSSIPLLSKKSSLLKSLSRLQDLSDLIFNQLCIPILNESPWCFGFMLSGMLSIKRMGLVRWDCSGFWELKVIAQLGHGCTNWDVQWSDLDEIDISKLVALLAISFCRCHMTGEWLHTQKAIKIKKHGRKAISIFRYGLDKLREILLNISEKKICF